MSFLGPRGSLFNDPFFTDPFGHMDRMMSSMLGGSMMMGHLPGGAHPQFAQQGLQDVNNQHGLNAPVIEEVQDEDGHHHAARAHSSRRDEPIVEEPDDDVHTQHRNQRQRRSSPARYARAQPPPSSSAFANGGGSGGALGFGFPGGGSLLDSLAAGMAGGTPGGAHVFSMSSSSVFSSSGPGGVTYQSTTTSRMGPGGVRETQSTVRDGRTGTESITITRGVSDRERTVTRVRDASGREVTEEKLRGLQGHEADRFDEEWRRQAEQNLLVGGPGRLGGRSASMAHGAGASSSQPRLALPSSGSGALGSRAASGTAARGYAAGAQNAAPPPAASSRSQPGMSRSHSLNHSYAPQYQQQQQQQWQQQNAYGTGFQQQHQGARYV